MSLIRHAARFFGSLLRSRTEFVGPTAFIAIFFQETTTVIKSALGFGLDPQESFVESAHPKTGLIRTLSPKMIRPPTAETKRPAEAGRRAGDTISGGAEREETPIDDHLQAEFSASNRVIAYIDGFNLYFGLKSKGWQRYYWLDLSGLCQSLTKPGQTLAATKYFTSRILPSAGNPDRHQRQNLYLDALEIARGLRPILGHYLPKRVACRTCGSAWQSFEEKRTDVNIAVEMLADAQADAFDTALLISADSDLSAPIEKVRSLFPNKRIVAAFPPARHSGQISKLVHASFTIGEAKLRQNQLPNAITKSNGYVILRPATWR